MKPILDACCGSKMFWFDKDHEDVIYIDNRELNTTLCDGRTLNVNPDSVMDFRDLAYDCNSFHLVVFDPPHLKQAGENSWLAKKYGKLNETWPFDIRQGFTECMRVLKPYGTLVFKWNEDQVTLNEVLDAIGYKPLFGNRNRGTKTHWLVFMKR